LYNAENPALRIAAASFCMAKDIAESLTPARSGGSAQKRGIVTIIQDNCC